MLKQKLTASPMFWVNPDQVNIPLNQYLTAQESFSGWLASAGANVLSSGCADQFRGTIGVLHSQKGLEWHLNLQSSSKTKITIANVKFPLSKLVLQLRGYSDRTLAYYSCRPAVILKINKKYKTRPETHNFTQCSTYSLTAYIFLQLKTNPLNSLND